jgi:integrase
MESLVPTTALTQMPFAAACEAYLESRRPYIATKTHHEYQLNIKTLAVFFGELRLQEIDGDLIRAYQRTRKLKCGPFAINHECGFLCLIRKRIGLPIEDYQPLPLPKEIRGRALSDEERVRLLRVAESNPHWEAAYLATMISVNTSAGPKETATLRLKDIDLQRDVIRVQPGGAKNVHRVRTIPLNDESRAAVKSALDRSQRLGAVQPEHYLFPFRRKRGNRHSGADHYDPTNHQTTFKTAWLALKRAAHIPNFRMYDLRHHAITALLENPEISEETAEDIAGHISRRMKKRYSHIRMKYRRAAVEAIGPKKPVKKEQRNTNRTAISTERDGLVSELSILLAKLLKGA